MNNPKIAKEFEKLVKNKFNVYNSLFLNLPYRKISNIGMLLPLMHHVCKQGLESGKEPLEILNSFFSNHTDIKLEEEIIDFMFRVIQYVERQVVLYDSVEDSAFSKLLTLNNHLSLKDYIYLLGSKKDGENILEKLSSFSTRIVFTAHPTQFYPPSVLDIIARLRLLIEKNDINEIDLTLQQLGLTSLINSKKPTPFDEAKNIIYFLQNVYYGAVTELYSYIKKSVQNPTFDNPNIIQLGFWPGGDRDGNPFVTSEITKDVADELRMTLMKCYYQDIKNLGQKLTFRKVEEIIIKLRTKLYKTMFDPAKAIKFEEIINPLNSIKKFLVNNYNSLYLEELENLIDKVKIFRTHFAVLDIRQNHSVHKQTVEAILKKEKLIKNNLDELKRDELISILLNHEIQINIDKFDDDIVKDTIRTIIEQKNIQGKNGEEGCNRYIISNAEDIFSVLFVYCLLRWCCWKKTKINIDIIPLFESMDGMANSELIMKELFEIPEYRSHIRHRKNIQTVMLGFSDGTKDGGYLHANWSIFKTKEILSELCDQYDIKAIFFDGRGGPPARGGGKTHGFYASQSQKIANHAIQLTIQGQTITSKYGTKQHFIHNWEQLLTAGLSNSLFENGNTISESSREIIEELARLSFEKYNALKNHKMFIPYLENKSTLKYYSEANIGSRPTKRGNKGKLELKDLRAIPFVGSWSQLKQNVPGYFGIGTAIQSLVNDGKTNELKNLFKEVPFFKALIHNSMMALSKCYFELTGYIAKNKEFKDFWNILFNEYKLSKEMTLLISGYDVLMEEEPVSKSSIEIREQIVLPLLVIQQFALQKIEQDSEHKNKYEKIVQRSLYGNINASRNSA
ncbi:MAG: phosphoenolpyruvate carboxylase [Calditrichaeota bacterium]|nr:MAG: phosphoenolpyruvate carboxylase [Calditrichota bacterium]MBL1205597.1 phosphoenolpyruvate carboxylase [Calditrichota bacterium]NOG45426.1 phosphoenolpyruvate carboxylase [Calditrichota bacterium]